MFRFCTAIALLLLAVNVPGVRAEQPPDTRREPVTDVYHGESVVDEYRWLEDAQDPAVKHWNAEQNDYARRFLDSLPGREQLRERIAEIMTATTVSYGTPVLRGGRFFALKRQPPKQQPFIVMFDSPNDPDRGKVLVDPNTMDSEGTTSIDWFEPSPDGKLLAVSLSVGGSEAGDVHVFDTESGEAVFEVVPRVNTGTAGGDLAWMPDSSGFFYTRHPRSGERPAEDMNFYQQAWFHKLGTPTADDRYELGADFPRIAEIEFEMHDASGQLLLTVQDGDGGRFAHYLKSPGENWRQFSAFEDETIQATFGSEDYLFVLTRRDAPRGRIVKVPTSTLDVESAVAVVAQSDDTIVNTFYHAPPGILATPTKLFVLYQLGGPSEVRVFSHDGAPQPGPKQMPVSSVGGLCPLSGDSILFSSESFVMPESVFRFDAQTGATTATALSSTSPVSFDDVEVKREFATSKDGTRIPLNIMIPASETADGPRPCIVYGYGGYAISLTPRFSAVRRVLFDAGIIYTVANIRGGGEFGEEWHQQGMLTRKQNVFDDFAAACRYMIDSGYTTSDRLATMGGSNGGLLMGATLTQHPQLMKAVVALVGIYDMLRVELSPNGSFNIPEFGSVQDPEQYAALRAYSPLHNVEFNTKYPAVLFVTGENDPRVDPMQSRKMTAKLQAATSGSEPILLRTSADAGHGADTPLDERIAQTVDVYSFLLHELAADK
ncbi:MAG: prolyl oligopeptidase family serine peptidase [Planctomycetaceae bacterium]